MASPVATLQAKLAALNAQQDRLLESTAKELARVLKAMDRALTELLDDVGRGQTSATVRAAQVATLRREMALLLVRSGYPELVRRLVQSPGLQAMTARVLRRVAGQAAADVVSGSTLVRVQAFQALLQEDILSLGEDLSRTLWRTAMRSIFAQQPRLRIVRELQRALDTSEAHARTAIDTALSVYSRQVDALSAEESDDPAFVYLGPVDSKLRPFCAERVGKVFTKAQIDKMDNGQLPGVLLTGGGYNCRHRFQEVSRFSELRDLIGTGKRAPEIAEQLKDVRIERRAA